MYLILTFIALPLLALISLVLLIGFIIARKRKYLIALAIMWLLVIGGYATLSTIARLKRPIRLKQKDIYGDYRIDTNFYPGANARWQYNRYRFTITDKDSLLLNTYDIYGRLQSTYGYKIRHSSSRFGAWNADSAKHHLLYHSPTLYRSHSSYYYVLKSTRYGNMFFRKSR